MRVSIQLKESTQPIEHNFINTYQKGAFYTVYTPEGKSIKYPINNIWRIVEEYGTHQLESNWLKEYYD